MANKAYGCIDLIGGGTGAVDKIDGALLADGDKCFVYFDNGETYVYNLDTDSSLSEDTTNYTVIAPDDNPGTKRWIRIAKTNRVIIGDGTIDQGNVAVLGSLAWHIDDLSTTPGTITILPGTYKITTNITLPATLKMEFIKGGVFKPDATKILTFNSPEHIIAGKDQQIIDTTNNSTDPLNFTNPGIVYPEWWGAVGDDSTNNNTATIAAVAGAYADGCTVHWTRGTYLITATIPNFHDTKHSGEGVLRFDTAGPIFAPVPDVYNTAYATPNQLFINKSTGADANLGIDSTIPFETIQACFDAAKKYGPVLGGYWKINLAAGTWTEGAEWTDIRSENFVRIVGPDVSWSTPTAIIDGTAATNSRGLLFTRRAFIRVENVKVQDFNDDSQHAGFQLGKFSQGYFLNCHAYNNHIGIFARDNSIIFIEGGTLDGVATGNGYEGLKIIGNTRYNTDYESSPPTTHTLTIQNCAFGAYMWEHATGHFDQVLCQSNTTGLNLSKLSLASINDTVFKGNTTAIVASDGSAYYLGDSRATTFDHAGTSNDKDDLLLAYSKQQTALNDGFSFSNECLRTDHTYASHTGDTDLTTLKTYTAYIPANSLVDYRQQLTIKANGIMSGNNGTAALNVYIGSDIIATVTVTQSASIQWELEVKVSIKGVATQSVFTKYLEHGQNPVIKYEAKTITLDESVGAQDIIIKTQLGNAGDTVGVHNVEVWRLG